MASNPTQKIISVIALNYIQPIASLFELMDKETFGTPNEVQAVSLENGYSISIIALSVFLLESTLNRTQYTQSRPLSKPSLDFVRKVYPSYADDLEELFVIRDTIAHNHIWEAEVEWDRNDQFNLKFVSPPKLIADSGDKKLLKVIDHKTRKSKRLGINLYPSRICRDDAVIVFKRIAEFLMFLEKQDRNNIYISHQHITYSGTLLEFERFIKRFN